MFCSKCGTSLNGAFCSACGNPSPANLAAPASGEPMVFVQTLNAPQISPNAQTSGLAITALVLSLFFPLIGMILGIVARNEISSSNGMKKGDGIANLAIILGLSFTILYITLFAAFFTIWANI